MTTIQSLTVYELRLFINACTGSTRYTLEALDTKGRDFLFSVSDATEEVSRRVSGSLSSVCLLFERVLVGGVPPYIFPEIIEDYETEGCISPAT